MGISLIFSMIFSISCSNNNDNKVEEKGEVVKVKGNIKDENKDIIKNQLIILEPFNEYKDKDKELINGKVNYSANEVDKLLSNIFEENEYLSMYSNTTISGNNILVYLHDSSTLNTFRYHYENKDYFNVTIDIAKSIRKMLIDLLNYNDIEIGFWTNSEQVSEEMLFFIKADGTVITCFQEGEYKY